MDPLIKSGVHLPTDFLTKTGDLMVFLTTAENLKGILITTGAHHLMPPMIKAGVLMGLLTKEGAHMALITTEVHPMAPLNKAEDPLSMTEKDCLTVILIEAECHSLDLPT